MFAKQRIGLGKRTAVSCYLPRGAGKHNWVCEHAPVTIVRGSAGNASIDGGTFEYDCEHCSKSVRTRKELREHVYYHHTPKKCLWCNIEFPGAYLYYYHNNKVHFETAECDVCHQKFKGRERLRIHKINKHMKDEEKPYGKNIRLLLRSYTNSEIRVSLLKTSSSR